MKRTAPSALIATLAILVLSPIGAESRNALLIANGRYARFDSLATTAAEARQLRGVLESLGFSVVVAEDAGRERMLDELEAFQARIAKAGGLALFHYGGHGVQSAGRNYLIPVDADIPDERRLSTRAVDLEEVTAALAGAETSIIVLDACRNNPLPAAAGRSATRGLAVLGSRPRNSLVVFSAEAGNVARDGLFTPALCGALAQRGLSLTEALMRVRREVNAASGGAQTPGEYDQLLAPVYLAGRPTAAAPAPAALQDAAPPGFVLVQEGAFVMGSPWGERDRRGDEQQHEVSLSSYYIAQREITFAEYDAFCEDSGRAKPDDCGWGRGDRPVMNVSWLDAVEYCNWRSRKEGLPEAYRMEGGRIACDRSSEGWRLPTEAEWERACRAGTATATAFGDLVTSIQANFDGAEPYPGLVPGALLGQTAPVGSYPSNAWGIYDMHGNVAEWCWDWYGRYSMKGRDPAGPDEGERRVLRGSNFAETERYQRSALRWNGEPDDRDSALGFRIAR